MSSAAVILDLAPPVPPSSQPGAARALVERQLAALTELVDVGMEIARAAGRRSVAALESEQPTPPYPDPTLAYARAAKAVRMAIALQARLLNDLPAIERGEGRALAELGQARRQRIGRLVEQAIEAVPAHDDEIERLSDRAWERLRDADDYSVLMTLPIAEAVARICSELGLRADAWVGEGSPFAPAAAGDDEPIPIPRSSRRTRGPRLFIQPHREPPRPGSRLPSG